MFGRLAELNITPELKPAQELSTKSEIVDRVIRRAQELQRSWHPIEGENTADKKQQPVSLWHLSHSQSG